MSNTLLLSAYLDIRSWGHIDGEYALAAVDRRA